MVCLLAHCVKETGLITIRGLQSVLVSHLKSYRTVFNSNMEAQSVFLRYVLSFAISLFTIYWVLKLHNVGIEFSDEGKYLVDITYPLKYDFVVSNYGLVYHPFFDLVEFNISSLRLMNVVLTFLIAVAVSYISIKETTRLTQIKRREIVYFSVVLGSASLSFFAPVWILTPSYNSLTFQCLMVLWLLILKMSSASTERKRNLFLFLIGANLALIFLAKPSTAGLIILLLPFALNNLGLMKKIYIPIASFVLIIFSVSLYKHKSITGIFFDLFYGSQYSKQVTDEYSIQILILPITLLILLFYFLHTQKSKLLYFYSKDSRMSGVLYVTTTSLCVAILMTLKVNLFFYLVLIPIISYFGKNGLLYSLPKNSNSLLLFPILGAFGSNNSLVIQSTMYSYFIILFGILVIVSKESTTATRKYTSFYLMFTSVIVLFSILFATMNPYRQPMSLAGMTNKINFHTNAGGLLVESDVLRYFSESLVKSRAAGFVEGSKIVDLTGQSTTLIHLLGGDIAGDSWLIGGYEGSNLVAQKKLRLIDCEVLSKTWLLIEPKGPRSLSFTETIAPLGYSYNNYSLAAEWLTAGKIGGYAEARRQILLRPKVEKFFCK